MQNTDKTLFFYRIYCWFNVGWYLMLGSSGIGGLLYLRSIDPDLISPDQIGILKGCAATLAITAVVFGTGTITLMRQPRTPKAHLAHYINICMGITTCVLAPFCIWLALQWQKPEIKSYFDQSEFIL